jgi:prophage tail gpP-like protein
MGPELVQIAAGGGNYTAFEAIEVTAGFNEAARAFALTLAADPDPGTTAWVFAPGTLVSITSNGDLLCTGYVDRYLPRLSEKNEAKINVAGRGKGQDAIDSSAIHPTGNFQNQTPLQIAQAIDPTDTQWSSDQEMAPLPFYQITPGETVFRCIEKLCRQQGLMLAGQADGSIKITKLSAGRQAPLQEGVNCKGFNSDHNWAGRHSHVIARGQRPIGNGAANLQIEKTAHDSAVGRYRPHVLVIDEDTDPTRAGKRAQYRLQSEAGNALKATVDVQGFHDDGGLLWTPGNTVFLDSDFLAVHQAMAIKRVAYRQSKKRGSTAQLTLVDPQALGGQSAQGGSANAAWDTSVSAAAGEGDGASDTGTSSGD